MDKQREDEICKIFEDIVKKHPDATADEGSLPDDMRFIPLEFWQAAQAAMQKDYALALEKIAKKPEIDKTEWFCEQCNCVYPTQSEGKIYQPCPVCKSAMKITSIDLRHIEELKQQLSAANQRNKELQSENETCRNLMRIKQEQNDAFSQRIAELEKDYAVWREYTGKVNDRNIELEERIRVADAEEPVAFSSDSLDGTSHLFWNKGQAMDLGFHIKPLYLHAQIPAEVELKAKIAELESIIKASQEQP